MRFAPLTESIPDSPDETTAALRDLFSAHPEAVNRSPEAQTGLLWTLGYVNRRPSEFEVVAALEALTLEGQVAA